jgi:phosphatidylglycerol lysyltransferase
VSATAGGGRPARGRVAVAVAAAGVSDILLAASADHLRGADSLGELRLSQAIGGPRYGLLVAGLVLLLTVPGLRSARRTAWWVALGLSAASVVAHRLPGLDRFGLLACAFAVGALVSQRRWFTLAADSVQAGRGWRLLALGEALVLAYGVAGLFLLGPSFRPAPSPVEAIGGALRLLLLLPATVQPASWHGRWFVESVRFVSLSVVLVALADVLRAAIVGPARRAADSRRVAGILERWGTSSLAPFHLLDDKSWSFSSDGEAFVGYAVVGRVAVALGGPVGDPASCDRAVEAFLARCRAQGWVPAFHQVGPDAGDRLGARGFRLLHVGDEAVVDLATFSLDGHTKKSTRSALRRVARSGHRVEELSQPIDDRTMAELRSVSDAWLAAGGHRERAFTVGRFDPAYLRSTRVLAVRDGDDRIVAFANVVPALRSGVGNFDLMRRRPEAVNGVMELLLVVMAERFRDEGLRGMTLGLAPLATIEGDGLGPRALRLLRAHGGALFRYGGLAGFKARWDPVWEPRYLAYPSPLDLPRVGLAVGRAGELRRTSGSRGPASAAVATARQFPFAAALLALQTWLMVATSLDPALERMLLHRFGVSWPALAHLQLWRLVTSTVIEPRAGIVWSNLLLLAIVPVAEWRLGPARTVTTFFLGDWAATLLTLGALHAAGGYGIGAARTAAAAFDAGPSAAAYAVLAATAVSIPSPTVRRAALGAIATSILVPLAIFTHLFDVQHLLSATAGAALGLRWLRKPDAVDARTHAASDHQPLPAGGVSRPIEGVPFDSETRTGTSGPIPRTS